VSAKRLRLLHRSDDNGLFGMCLDKFIFVISQFLFASFYLYKPCLKLTRFRRYEVKESSLRPKRIDHIETILPENGSYRVVDCIFFARSHTLTTRS
jgi:hypothetical protein